MATVTWSTVTKTLFESTLVIEHEFNNRADLFVEYGAYTKQDQSSQIVDVGGEWHLTPTQQVDSHLGAGLTRTAPHHYVGVGHSFRFRWRAGAPDWSTGAGLAALTPHRYGAPGVWTLGVACSKA